MCVPPLTNKCICETSVVFSFWRSLVKCAIERGTNVTRETGTTTHTCGTPSKSIMPSDSSELRHVMSQRQVDRQKTKSIIPPRVEDCRNEPWGQTNMYACQLFRMVMLRRQSRLIIVVARRRCSYVAPVVRSLLHHIRCSERHIALRFETLTRVVLQMVNHISPKHILTPFFGGADEKCRSLSVPRISTFSENIPKLVNFLLFEICRSGSIPFAMIHKSLSRPDRTWSFRY